MKSVLLLFTIHCLLLITPKVASLSDHGITRPSLPTAFGFGDAPELVAIVGGGGKTSLMFALAHELGTAVLTSTTTRIFQAQIKLAPAVVYAADLAPLAEDLRRFGTALVVGEVDGEKVRGIPPELAAELWQRPDVRHLILEADGSRMRPCKAPAAHEPVIPAETTLVIPVIGIDALGKPVAQAAHRPELVCQLTGLQATDVLTEEALAILLTHEAGGLKNVPPGARVVPLINKVESAVELAAARRIAQMVLRHGRIQQVVLGAVQSEQPVREVMRRVTAVILAAGEGRRMGQLKQLMPWGGGTVLGQTLRQAAGSLVHDVVVVTGHEAAAVAAAMAAEIAQFEGRPQPRMVHNPQYQSGEMLSSLQQAVRRLVTDEGTMWPPTAVLVLLADQPMVSSETINQILCAYWQGCGDLIAPTYQGQRGNPVLIGRRYFAELLALPVGSAPRALLQAHASAVYLLPVETDTILHDLDTPQEYEKWAEIG